MPMILPCLLKPNDPKRLMSNDLPKHPCSAFFQVIPAFSIGTLIQDFKSIGVMPRSLKCLQRVPNDSYIITLGSTQDHDNFVKNSSVIARPANPAIKITVFDAPYELPDQAIRHCLEQYGEIRSVKRLFILSIRVLKMDCGGFLLFYQDHLFHPL